jgi:hypothetical protein
LALVYQQIAKARAAKSLEQARAEVQPAIERVTQLMREDMKKLDELVQLAAKAQGNALKIAPDMAARLGYRDQLVGRRDVLMKQVDAALQDGRKATDVTDASELKREGSHAQASCHAS